MIRLVYDLSTVLPFSCSRSTSQIDEINLIWSCYLTISNPLVESLTPSQYAKTRSLLWILPTHCLRFVGADVAVRSLSDLRRTFGPGQIRSRENFELFPVFFQ